MGTTCRSGVLALGCAIVFLVAFGCGHAVTHDETSSHDKTETPSAVASLPILEILEPRAQLMPGMGAVYLRVVNTGQQGDRLVSIETPIAGVVETHESIEEDGVMRMVAHPEGFEIPPNGTVDLAPGGKHAMLIDPQTPAEGATIPLTLHFETSASIEVEAKLMTMEGMGH